MTTDLFGAIKTLRENYSGPKIAFLILGGGFSCLDFRRFPGSSKFYHTAIEPYGEDAANFLSKYSNTAPSPTDPLCNAKTTLLALAALTNYCNDPNLLYVVVNSALTTDRWRRGENRAYIATSRGDMYEMHISKLAEDEYSALGARPNLIDMIRHEEDEKVGQAAISIIMEDPSIAPELNSDEQILRIHNVNSALRANPNDVFASGR